MADDEVGHHRRQEPGRAPVERYRPERLSGERRNRPPPRQRIQLGNPNQASLANPLTLAGTPAAPNPLRNFADTQATLDSKAYAVFGQATYTPAVLADALHLTLGGRWTRDEKDGRLYLGMQGACAGCPSPRRARRSTGAAIP